MRKNLLDCDGKSFSGIVEGRTIKGKISLHEGDVFLCQNVLDGLPISKKYGYQYSYYVGEGVISELPVRNFKLLDDIPRTEVYELCLKYEGKKFAKLDDRDNVVEAVVVGYSDKANALIVGVRVGDGNTRAMMELAGAKFISKEADRFKTFSYIPLVELKQAINDKDEEKKYPHIGKGEVMYEEIGGKMCKFKYKGNSFMGIICGYGKSTGMPLIAITSTSGPIGWNANPNNKGCKLFIKENNLKGYLVMERKALTLIDKDGVWDGKDTKSRKGSVPVPEDSYDKDSDAEIIRTYNVYKGESINVGSTLVTGTVCGYNLINKTIIIAVPKSGRTGWEYDSRGVNDNIKLYRYHPSGYYYVDIKYFRKL